MVFEMVVIDPVTGAERVVTPTTHPLPDEKTLLRWVADSIEDCNDDNTTPGASLWELGDFQSGSPGVQ
jgi:hypothetical protein